MSTDISAWTAHASHLPHLIQLGRTYYPGDHPVLTDSFLKWFYLDNPAGPATLVVAHEGERWVGLVVLIPVMLAHVGREQKACYAVNVLTHPEYRSQGLFSKMISHVRNLLSTDGVWLLGHPNVHAMPGWTRQKMQFREPLQLYFAKFQWPFSTVRQRRIKDLQELKSVPPGFWEKLGGRPDIHIRYTPEFVAWRYMRAPHRTYAVSAIERGEDFLGLRVTRHFKWNIDLMVDFIGPPESMRSLLSGVRKPTLVMHPGHGLAAEHIRGGCWKPPVRRQLPFFVSTWEDEPGFDMSGITLAASDF